MYSNFEVGIKETFFFFSFFSLIVIRKMINNSVMRSFNLIVKVIFINEWGIKNWLSFYYIVSAAILNLHM